MYKEGNPSQNTDDTSETMDQMFSCEKCSRMFRSRKGLAVHNHCHADKQQSGCALCKKVLYTAYDVLNHRCVMTPTLFDVPDNSNNTNRAQPTFCTRCYDILVTPDDIRFHECTTNQHNYEEDFFICGVCRAAYPTKKHLIGHISPVHVLVYHSCLKKYFSNSTKSLDKYFMKNNHHLDFLQGLFSASGIETAFFH